MNSHPQAIHIQIVGKVESPIPIHHVTCLHGAVLPLVYVHIASFAIVGKGTTTHAEVVDIVAIIHKLLNAAYLYGYATASHQVTIHFVQLSCSFQSSFFHNYDFLVSE